MKAISLWQPHASLIPGPKGLETRSWNTSYRGPLLICAAKKRLTRWEFFYFINSLIQHGVLAKVVKFLLPPENLAEVQDKFYLPEIMYLATYNYLPYGKAVAICDLVATYKTEDLVLSQIQGFLPFGDFSPKRFAWQLENRRAIEPFSVRGRQRIFEVEVPGLEFKDADL